MLSSAHPRSTMMAHVKSALQRPALKTGSSDSPDPEKGRYPGRYDWLYRSARHGYAPRGPYCNRRFDAGFFSDHPSIAVLRNRFSENQYRASRRCRRDCRADQGNFVPEAQDFGALLALPKPESENQLQEQSLLRQYAFETLGERANAQKGWRQRLWHWWHECPYPAGGSATCTEAPNTVCSRPGQLVNLSANSLPALSSQARQLRQHLEQHPAIPLEHLAYTLHTGRRRFRYGRSWVVPTVQALHAALDQ